MESEVMTHDDYDAILAELTDADRRLADRLIAGLEAAGLRVGINEPYSPADRVYFTLERHGRSRGLPCAMIEIRNDEIGDEAGQRRWSETLARILAEITVASEREQTIA